MRSQHWFMAWCTAIRQQTFVWTNVDPDLCHQMESLGHKELKGSGSPLYYLWAVVYRYFLYWHLSVTTEHKSSQVIIDEGSIYNLSNQFGDYSLVIIIGGLVGGLGWEMRVILQVFSKNTKQGNWWFLPLTLQSSDLTLFVASDVLVGSTQHANNHARIHARFAKEGFATRATLQGTSV